MAIGRLAGLMVLGALLTVAAGCNSPSQRIEELSTSPEATGGLAAEEIQVRDTGFVWDGETLSYAFTAQNISEDTSMEEALVQINVYGLNDEPIAGDTAVIDFVLPGQVVAYAAHLALREEPGRIALSFTAEDTATVKAARTFEPVSGKYETTNYGGRVIAAINNPYERELRRLKVVAILRGEDGKILSGGGTVLELLPAHGESAVTIDILGTSQVPPAQVEVYTMFSAETVFRLE